jgi:hypothetical protein
MAGFTTVDDYGRVALDTERDEPTGCTVEYLYSLRSNQHEATLHWPDGTREAICRDTYSNLRDTVNAILVDKGGYGPWVLALVVRTRHLTMERVWLRRSAHGDWEATTWREGVAPPDRDAAEAHGYYTAFDGDTLPARCTAFGYPAVALPYDPALGMALDAYMAARGQAHGRMVALLETMVDRSRLPQVQGDDDPARVPTFLLNLVRAERDILAAGSPGAHAYDLKVALADLLVAMHDRARWGDGIPDELIPLVGNVAERAGVPLVWWDDSVRAQRRYVLDGVWTHEQYDRWRRGAFAHLAPALRPDTKEDQ